MLRLFPITVALAAAIASAAPTRTVTTTPDTLLARDAEPGCSDTSFGALEWGIEAFDFHASYIFTTPAHQNSWGFVNFNLSNTALDYQAECKAQSIQLSDFFYGNVDYHCTGPEGSSADTSFRFSRYNNKLDITQSWSCSDRDPQYPTRFTATGSVELTLSCTDETTKTPDWQPGGPFYSDREIRCDPATLTLKPDDISAVA